MRASHWSEALACVRRNALTETHKTIPRPARAARRPRTVLCVPGHSVSCSTDALLAADRSSHSNDRQPGASQRHIGTRVTSVAGGDEPRRLCCSVSPADQCELATVLVPDGCLALRCAFVASESHGGTRSAPLTFEPRRLRNARTFRGRRVTRADRGMVLCVSAAGTSRRGPSNGMGGSEGGWAQKRRRDEKGGSLACHLHRRLNHRRAARDARGRRRATLSARR